MSAELNIISRIPGKHMDHVYTVGPFGINVGFLFQQTRALNLIWDIKKNESKLAQKNIAVIGAGVAGVTTALGLKGLGCRNVILYEKEKEILSLQSSADFRLVHPSYNSWPMVVDEKDDLIIFNSTTCLPFCNWTFGSAKEITTDLRQEIKGNFKDLKIEEEYEFEDLEYNQEAKNYSLTFKGRDPVQADVVIFCTGFGVERDLNVSSANGYWEESPILEKGDFAKDYMVVGLGDGALYDIISLCFGIENTAAVILGAIELLRHPTRRNFKIDAFKDKHSLNHKGVERSETEKHIYEIESKIIDDTDPDALGELNQLYKFIVGGLGDKEREWFYRKLSPAFMESDDKIITLVGRSEYPFRKKSAPIHKIIIAYLLLNHPNKVKYQPNTAYVNIDGKPALRPNGNKKATKINMSETNLILRLESEPFVQKKWYQQDKSLTDMIKKFKAYNNRGLDAEIEKFTPFWEDERIKRSYLLNNYICKNYSGDFLQSRCSKTNTVNIYPNLKLSIDKIIQGVEKIKDYSKKSGGIDHKIFGYKVVFSEIEVMD